MSKSSIVGSFKKSSILITGIVILALTALPAWAQQPEEPLETKELKASQESYSEPKQNDLRLSLEEIVKNLGPEEAEIFLKRRQYVLDSAQQTLSHTSLVFGVAGLVKDKIVQVFKRNSPYVSHSLGDYRQAFVKDSLASIDNTLREQARLLAHSTEAGLQINVGVGSIHGVGTKVKGGLREVGINIGVNFKERYFVLDIFTDSEKVVRAFTPTSAMGLTYSLNMYLSNLSAQELKHIKGVTFYPPMVPAAFIKAPNYFATGYSSSMGWPPGIGVYSPADLFSYESELTRTSRFTIRSRIIFEAMFVAYKGGQMLLAPVRTIYSMLKKAPEFVASFNFMARRSSRTCSKLFTFTPL